MLGIRCVMVLIMMKGFCPGRFGWGVTAFVTRRMGDREGWSRTESDSSPRLSVRGEILEDGYSAAPYDELASVWDEKFETLLKAIRKRKSLCLF